MTKRSEYWKDRFKGGYKPVRSMNKTEFAQHCKYRKPHPLGDGPVKTLSVAEYEAIKAKESLKQAE